MPLSTVNIDNLIEQTTDLFITTHPNYTTLRNSSISLSAISHVISEIQSQLDTQFEQDKQKVSSQLTAEACNKQMQQDEYQQKKDIESSQEDLQLASRLGIELATTNEKMRSNDRIILNDQQNMGQIQAQLREIERRIELATHEHQHMHQHSKESSEHQHAHPSTDTHNTHTHTPLTHEAQQSHVHKHASLEEQHSHIHEHPTVTEQQSHAHAHSHSESAHHQTELLIRQKSDLSNQLSAVERDLRSKASTQNQYQRRIEEITRILHVDLLENDKQREKRRKAREERAQARLKDDPSLLQLSSQNRSDLSMSIASEHLALSSKHNQLMQKAKDKSYLTYLSRLEILLPTLVRYQHSIFG